jgi:DNA-binding CsgD family transcriptional regulator/PAS domain-containing protein
MSLADRLAQAVTALVPLQHRPFSWDAALRAVAAATRAERATILVLDAGGRPAQISWPPAAEGLLEYARDYAHRDLRVQRVADQRLRGVLSSRQLLSAEEIARCPVHQEFYRRWPECWNTLAGPVDMHPELAAPTVHRGAVRSDFDDDEARAFGVLLPHIAEAARWHPLHTAAQVLELEAAFEAMREATFLLGAAGRLLLANAAARAMLRSGDAIQVRRGFLAAAKADCRSRLDRAIAQALNAATDSGRPPPDDVVLSRGNPLRPAIAGFLPVPASGGKAASVLIRIREPAQLRDPSIEVVRIALGLTTAEAKLALAIARGEAVEEYAARTRTSGHTARTHLRNLRSKIGATRQTEVVRAILDLRQ